LPGLEKLGLRHLPHAVACAQYHYLSNDVGGVRVEYMYESARKAWVRYVPPRWIYDGATICAAVQYLARPAEVFREIARVLQVVQAELDRIGVGGKRQLIHERLDAEMDLRTERIAEMRCAQRK